MKNIVIIGTTGSGKTTLAKNLSKELNINHTSLDSLFWKKDWKESSDSEFFSKIKDKLNQNDDWIIDGNYTRAQHLIWPKADTVIWLNLPFHLNFYQTVSRAIYRIISKKELWEDTGNKESLKMLLSKDSIILWFFRCFWKNKKKYKDKISSEEFKHINFITLGSRKEINDFLKSVQD